MKQQLYLEKVAQEVGETKSCAALGFELFLHAVGHVAGQQQLVRGQAVTVFPRHRFLVPHDAHHSVESLWGARDWVGGGKRVVWEEVGGGRELVEGDVVGSEREGVNGGNK